MTREDAIREMMFAKRNVIADSFIDKAYDMAIEALKATQWISCSERLPDKDFTDVLVQIGHGEYALYETAYRVRGRWVFYSDRQDGEWQSVIAWMPLPSPYQEDES